MENESDKKIEQIIEALESPSSFTPDELKELFSDKENLKIARSILHAKEALARQNIPAPEVDREWEKFKCRHKKKSTLVIFIGLVTAACITLLFRRCLVSKICLILGLAHLYHSDKVASKVP